MGRESESGLRENKESEWKKQQQAKKGDNTRFCLSCLLKWIET